MPVLATTVVIYARCSSETVIQSVLAVTGQMRVTVSAVLSMLSTTTEPIFVIVMRTGSMRTVRSTSVSVTLSVIRNMVVLDLSHSTVENATIKARGTSQATVSVVRDMVRLTAQSTLASVIQPVTAAMVQGLITVRLAMRMQT